MQVVSRVWTDLGYLSFYEKLVFMYILTGPCFHRSGLFHLPISLMTDQTGLPREAVLQALATLEKSGLILYDHEHEMILILKIHRFIPPRKGNPAVVKKGIENHLKKYEEKVSETMVLTFFKENQGLSLTLPQSWTNLLKNKQTFKNQGLSLTLPQSCTKSLKNKDFFSTQDFAKKTLENQGLSLTLPMFRPELLNQVDFQSWTKSMKNKDFFITDVGSYKYKEKEKEKKEKKEEKKKEKNQKKKEKKKEKNKKEKEKETLLFKDSSCIFSLSNNNNSTTLSKLREESNNITITKLREEEENTKTKLLEEYIYNNNTKKEKEEIPYFEIVKDFNSVMGRHYRHNTVDIQVLIRARWNDGFRLEDFKIVHRKMKAAWGRDPKMKKYLRPHTLYTRKFQSYLNYEVDEAVGFDYSETTAHNLQVAEDWLKEAEDDA